MRKKILDSTGLGGFDIQAKGRTESLRIDNRLTRQFTMTSEPGPHEGTMSSTCGQKWRNPRGLTRALALLGSPGEAQVPARKLNPKEEYDGVLDKLGDPEL